MRWWGGDWNPGPLTWATHTLKPSAAVLGLSRCRSCVDKSTECNPGFVAPLPSLTQLGNATSLSESVCVLKDFGEGKGGKKSERNINQLLLRHVP